MNYNTVKIIQILVLKGTNFMNQSNLSKWLKLITILVGIMGVIVFIIILPQIGKEIMMVNKEYEVYYWPWLLFIWFMAIPCYFVLVLFWSICNEIASDRSFSIKNARLLGWISRLAIVDTLICFIGNILFFFLGMSHPSIFIGFLFVIFAGIAVAVVSAALAHLVEKASVMQDENDLTI